MKLITDKNHQGEQCVLVNLQGKELRAGDTVKNFRGEKAIVVSGEAPRSSNSTGYVSVKYESGSTGRYYATVFDLKWREPSKVAA